MSALPQDAYERKLRDLPTPGSGQGFNAGMPGVARVGQLAGLSADKVESDLRRVADRGTRPVSDSEIKRAVGLVYNSTAPAITRHKPRPVLPGPATLAGILERGRKYGDADLWEASPVRLVADPLEDARLLLRHLYQPEERLFIGHNYSSGPRYVRTVEDWLKEDLTRWPHIAPNPMTGNPAPCKADPKKMTYRGDASVAAHRFCVVEFDGLPLEDQLRFWAGVNLPVVALITSGGKSVHGWLRVDVPDAAAWEAQVRPLYHTRLVPLGVDGACANPARLSRLPGHYREDKGQRQRLLFLDPAAKGPRHYLTGEGRT